MHLLSEGAFKGIKEMLIKKNPHEAISISCTVTRSSVAKIALRVQSSQQSQSPGKEPFLFSPGNHNSQLDTKYKNNAMYQRSCGKADLTLKLNGPISLRRVNLSRSQMSAV